MLQPVLSKDKCVLLKDTAVTSLRLEAGAPWSRVKHSTTEPIVFPGIILKTFTHALDQLQPMVKEAPFH